MKANDKYYLFFLVIFIISSLLRVSLALVNTKANDNHFQVIQIIKNENRIPEKDDCWECFQPKLFHYFSAQLLKILPIDNIEIQKITIQLVNSLAGILTIYLIYLFIKRLAIHDSLKLIGFSLAALNPRLIGINIQITNDSFVILLATLSIYFFYLFLEYQKNRDFYLTALFSILAGLTKGNGLIVFFIFSFIILIKIFFSWHILELKKLYLKSLIIFVILYLVIVPFLGQYLNNYFKYGSPLVINVDSYSKIKGNNYWYRPGLTSIIDFYFTFRFIDLIKHPLIYNLKFRTINLIRDQSIYNGNLYPLHRTSLWTQLYGRYYFLQFDDWPLAKVIPNKIIINIGRLLFILAIFPTVIFLLGLYKDFLKLINPIVRLKFGYLRADNDWIFTILTLAFFAFIILFTYQYRDFGTMKIEFILPGLICFLKIFLDGLKIIYGFILKYKKIYLLFNSLLEALLIFYLIDITTLFIQLT